MTECDFHLSYNIIKKAEINAVVLDFVQNLNLFVFTHCLRFVINLKLSYDFGPRGCEGTLDLLQRSRIRNLVSLKGLFPSSFNRKNHLKNTVRKQKSMIFLNLCKMFPGAGLRIPLFTGRYTIPPGCFATPPIPSKIQVAPLSRSGNPLKYAQATCKSKLLFIYLLGYLDNIKSHQQNKIKVRKTT